MTLTATTEITHVRGYGKEGVTDKCMLGGALTTLRVRLSLGQEGLNDLQAWSETSIFSHFWQRLVRTADGGVAGSSARDSRA